ncbi:MAG: acyl-CoA reductase [Thermoanaerobaculia bacterium]
MSTRFAVPPGAEPETDHWTAPELARLAVRLADRGPGSLATVPSARRLEIWDETLDALLDPESRERRTLFPALLATSGLSAEGLSEALEVVLAGLAGGAARELARDLPAGGPRPPGGVILAGNIPGLAAQSLLPALLAGRPLLFKSSSDEPLFAAALIRALAAREPALGEAFAAVAFPGSEPELLDAAFLHAARIVAYGGESAIASLRGRFGDRLVAHGPKASVALVADDVDPLTVARKLARDICLFDQRGCLSVQAIYSTLPAEPLAEALEWALALEERRLPPGAIDPGAAALVQQLRAGAALAGEREPQTPLTAGTILVASGRSFRPGPGARTVRIHALDALAEAPAALAPWRGRLQGFALAGAAAWELEPELLALGASRLADAGELQSVGAGWRNGGLDPAAVFA